MKNFFTTKRICRAGVIAALYVALTYAFGQLSYQGILQIRPAEALTILALFFPEAVPALWIGCVLANLLSGYGWYDIVFGGLTSLVAAVLTYGTGKLIKNHVLKIIVGGFFPVILNAIVVPLLIVFAAGDLCGYETATIAYFINFGSMLLTQALWIYGLGSILYFSIVKLQQRGVSVFISETKKKPDNTQTENL
ncbi:MAG: QueT transporter family protein [Clostridia bacterium]|nr:QueT transporter family protein [Clostridia bacterium]